MFARYLDWAAEGFFRFWLGRRAGELVAQAYVEPDNEYSFQNVIFAELDSRVVGMAVGSTAERRHDFSDRPLRKAKGFPALRASVVSVLYAPMFRLFENIAEGEFYLLAVAVDEEARGRGVGSTLLDHVEERARLGLHTCGRGHGIYGLFLHQLHGEEVDTPSASSTEYTVTMLG